MYKFTQYSSWLTTVKIQFNQGVTSLIQRISATFPNDTFTTDGKNTAKLNLRINIIFHFPPNWIMITK